MTHPISTYSAVGEYHRQSGIPCQDAILSWETDGYITIALADGVTACEFGGIGAKLAVKEVCRLMSECPDLIFGYEDTKIASLAVKQVRAAIMKEADVGEDGLDGYASTLAFACLEKSTGRLMIFSLGDSIVYLLSDSGCTPAAVTPQSFTVSADAPQSANVQIIDSAGVNGVMICSDGAWSRFYDGNIFKQELYSAAGSGDYSAFIRHLSAESSADDSSLILMEL